MKRNRIPELPQSDLTSQELQRKRELMLEEVGQIPIDGGKNLIELMNEFAKSSFQARNLGRAAQLYYKQALSGTGIIWSLAGSLFGAGLRQITIDAVRKDLVDVLICTGALFEQDMMEALGHKHYICEVEQEDQELQSLGIDRVYDHLLDEMGLRQVDLTFKQIATEMSEGHYSSREFLEFAGRWLANTKGTKDSVMQAAYEKKTPIFIPAVNDSSIGIGLAMHQKENEEMSSIDSIKDLRELAYLKSKCGDTGIIVVGGGVPKNYSQDAVVVAEMLGYDVQKHKFGIQISTADVRDGGLSGSTLKEAISWGKNDKEIDEVMVWGEATVCFPLLVGYVYNKLGKKGREGRQLGNIFK
ncbi:MAG: deoxyhypusine synthase family protein [Candidatus Thermoplasmatota archaeon]|nr:deoxyhypusine synthase family protein [Candidatus Thermoplasmatota archaeon]